MKNGSDQSDAVFHAIAEPNRRKMLLLLISQAMAVSTLCGHFDLSQSAVSQHLRVLRDAGLVEVRTEWRHRIYRITPERLQVVAAWVQQFEQFWESALDKLADQVEREENDDV